MIKLLEKVLQLPLARGLSIDDPATTELRQRIIQQKGFLRRIYEEWYDLIKSAVPAGNGSVLELGSGGGFLRRSMQVIASDVFLVPSINVVLDARSIPLRDRVLRAIVMTNVLHHVPDIETFLREAARTVRPGGVMVMIEPWNTPWARWVYSRLHPEPFDACEASWGLSGVQGPLSSANVALPWIVFSRDHWRLEAEFPQWKLQSTKLLMPAAYIVSGGVSLRSLVPAWVYRPFRMIESLLPAQKCAMFALVVLRRTECD